MPEHSLALALKIALFQAFPRDFEVSSHGVVSEDMSATLDTLVQSKVESLLTRTQPVKPSIPQMGAVLEKEIDRIAKEIRVLNHGAFIRKCLDMLKSASQGICCERCQTLIEHPSSNGQPCQHCHRVPAADRYCIGFFSESFGQARDIALKSYGDAGIHVNPALTTFDTGWVHESYQPEGMPENIHAFPSVDCSNASVCLNLKPRLFNRATFESLLYLLLHEWICHAVPALVYRAEGGDFPEPPSDAFAEGWMDHIAFKIFMRAVSGQSSFPSALRPPCEWQIPEFIHNFRVQLSSASGSHFDLNAPRRKARNAVEHLISEAIELTGNDIRRGEDIGIGLSLKLNVLPLTELERDRVISQVRSLFPRYAKTYGRPYLEKYAENGDIGEFVSAVS